MENKTLLSEIIQTQQNMYHRKQKSPAFSIQGSLIIVDTSVFVCSICDALMKPSSQKKKKSWVPVYCELGTS